jgi:hypothetical protein
MTVLMATFFNVSGPLTITEGIEAPRDCSIDV